MTLFNAREQGPCSRIMWTGTGEYGTCLQAYRCHKQHPFYSAQRLDLFAWCVRLSRLLVGFRTHFKSLHFLLLLLLTWLLQITYCIVHELIRRLWTLMIGCFYRLLLVVSYALY